jgi:homocysteine S-methyltransferase
MSDEFSFRDWSLGCSSEPYNVPILLLDGGVSTHLLETGGFELPSNASSTDLEWRRMLWSSDLLRTKIGQDAIQRGHCDWLEASANVISTVTYQCHFESKLWPQGMTEDIMQEMILKAISLADTARRKSMRPDVSPALVAVSLGCYGSALANGAEYTGLYGDDCSIDSLMQFYHRKIQLSFRSDSVNVLALETIPSFIECQALAKYFTDIPESTRPFWISLSCQVVKDSNGITQCRLRDGTELTSIWDTLRTIPREKVVAWGFNCCRCQDLVELVTHLWSYMMSNNEPLRALVIYPNLGEEWNGETKTWERTENTCAQFDENVWSVVQELKQAWKALCKYNSEDMPMPRILVGGCCRTTPDHIRRLRLQISEQGED